MKTKFLAFGNQKGGVGKSTLNSMLANHIYHHVSQSIVVIDADDLQQSLMTIRQNIDLEAEENEAIYEVLNISSADVVSFCDKQLRGQVEYVIIDLPGNLKQPGVIQSYTILDFLFIPMELSLLDTTSSVEFVKTMRDKVIPSRLKAKYPETKMYGVLNKVKKNGQEFKDFQKEGPEMLGFTDLDFLENYIVDSSATFQRGVSTNENYKHSTYPSMVKNFCNEIIDLMK